MDCPQVLPAVPAARREDITTEGNMIEVYMNPGALISKIPSNQDDTQTIVSYLNNIWNMMVTSIRDHESFADNRGNNKHKVQKKKEDKENTKERKNKVHKIAKSNENPIKSNANNKNNVCNTATIATDNSKDDMNRKYCPDAIKDGISQKRIGFEGVKEVRKSLVNNNTAKAIRVVNTVISVARIEQVTKLTTTSNVDEVNRSKTLLTTVQSLKRKSMLNNVTDKRRRTAKTVAQRIVNDILNREKGNAIGVNTESKISEVIDLRDESDEEAMTNDDLNKTKEKEEFCRVFEISDDDDETETPKIRGTAVISNAKHIKTNGDTNGDIKNIDVSCDGATQDNFYITNEISITPIPLLSNAPTTNQRESPHNIVASRTCNKSFASVQSSCSVIMKSGPSSTSNSSAQRHIVSPPHPTTPLNLKAPKKSVIPSRSRLSLTPLAHTTSTKSSAQKSPLSHQQSLTNYFCGATDLSCSKVSARSRSPVSSSPEISIRMPSVPTPEKSPNTSYEVASRSTSISTPVAMKPGQLCSSNPSPESPFVSSPFPALPNLPLSKRSTTTSREKSSAHSCIQPPFSYIPDLGSVSPTQSSSFPSYQSPYAWHTPVTTPETTSIAIPNTFIQSSSPVTSSPEALSSLRTEQRYTASPYANTSSKTSEPSKTSKSRKQRSAIPSQTVQSSLPATEMFKTLHNFVGSSPAFEANPSQSSSHIRVAPPTVHRNMTALISTSSHTQTIRPRMPNSNRPEMLSKPMTMANYEPSLVLNQAYLDVALEYCNLFKRLPP